MSYTLDAIRQSVVHFTTTPMAWNLASLTSLTSLTAYNHWTVKLIPLLPINSINRFTSFPYSLDIGNQQIGSFIQVPLDPSRGVRSDDHSRMCEEWVIVR